MIQGLRSPLQNCWFCFITTLTMILTYKNWFLTKYLSSHLICFWIVLDKTQILSATLVQSSLVSVVFNLSVLWIIRRHPSQKLEEVISDQWTVSHSHMGQFPYYPYNPFDFYYIWTKIKICNAYWKHVFKLLKCWRYILPISCCL